MLILGECACSLCWLKTENDKFFDLMQWPCAVHQRLKSWSILCFTSSLILINGGQGRLKPSPGIFFVASMPSLLPLAISLVAWSSTSAGPLVSPCGRPKCCRVAGRCWRRGERGRPACRGRRLAGDIVQSTRKVSARRRNQHARRVCSPTPDEVVEDAFGRQREVHDLGEVHRAPSPQPLSHRMGEGGQQVG